MDEIYLDKIRKEARNNHIPILLDETMEYVLDLLKKRQINSVLEIGTAIGYSASCFTKILQPNGYVDTIEIEEQRVNEARDNIEKLGLSEKINVYYGDALDILPTLISKNKKYDFIFIDASKGKYLEFFNFALELLNDNGIIIADNVLYKGMVLSDYNGHKHRTAVTKLRKFIEYIQNIVGMTSEIIDIGDGISITYKRKEEELNGTKG